ncbi:MAG: SagB/ThcOx family dehydrogenase [Methanocellales archaeon]|nr:SagB/ThcOx family dehydrogenase [Methanocellales archaeon]
MKWTRRAILKLIALMGATSLVVGAYKYMKGDSKILLPKPSKDGEISVEEAIASRRSIWQFRPGAIELRQLSQLLWAAQGITDPRGFRAAPSAGALYPLEIFIVTGEVEELEEGIYHYDVEEHALELRREGDLRHEIAIAASNVDQRCASDRGRLRDL